MWVRVRVRVSPTFLKSWKAKKKKLTTCSGVSSSSSSQEEEEEAPSCNLNPEPQFHQSQHVYIVILTNSCLTLIHSFIHSQEDKSHNKQKTTKVLTSLSLSLSLSQVSEVSILKIAILIIIIIIIIIIEILE
jgi:hypothetical protein